MQVQIFVVNFPEGNGYGYEKAIVVDGYVYQYTYDPNGFMSNYQFYPVPFNGGMLEPLQESDCQTTINGYPRPFSEMQDRPWVERSDDDGTIAEWVQRWTQPVPKSA